MDDELRLRRVAIAVRNVEQAKSTFETLFDATFMVPLTGIMADVKCVVWQRGGGDPALELVEPRDEKSPLARFIRKRGEGIHHLSFAVRDLDAAVLRISRTGGRVIETSSYYCDRDGNPLREAFLHPKDANGVLFHLVEEA